MAKVWVKSLQCKSSSATDDVYCPKPSPNSRNNKPLLPLSRCSNSSRALRDVVVFFPKPNPPPASSCELSTTKSKPKPKPKPEPDAGGRSTSFPTLTELPEGHSSRRVVEIIFTSSWPVSSSSSSRFAGRIDMLFRVHNPPRAVARFEEYRAAVRSLAAADSRCAVDGNEMMRFHCPPGPLTVGGGAGVYDATVLSSPDGFRTFAGSGGAHESASGGGGNGTRSMLVCRVITGRVREGRGSEGESTSGAGKGELIVLDERAILPCFLIIYSNTSSPAKPKLVFRKHNA